MLPLEIIMQKFTNTVKSLRFAYTESFDLDDWRDLAEFLRLIYSSKPIKFFDSNRKMEIQ